MELHAQIACAMPRELMRKGVGWQDRAVYTEAIYYGRENLTDGIIHRTELALWMPDMAVRERVRRLDALRDKGALLDHPDGWRFPEHVWRKWGKTREQVEAKRAAEAERLREYRERKRTEGSTNGDRTTVRTSYVHGAYETPKPQPYPEPEPEPDTSRSPTTPTVIAPDVGAEDDRNGPQRIRAASYLRAVGTR